MKLYFCEYLILAFIEYEQLGFIDGPERKHLNEKFIKMNNLLARVSQVLFSKNTIFGKINSSKNSG